MKVFQGDMHKDRMIFDEKIKLTVHDFNRNFTTLRHQQESNTLRMGNQMKDEFHFLIKRFRHKLLF